MTIVEFLTARLDEDEAEVDLGDFVGSDIGARAAERIDADIAVKRAILGLHQPESESDDRPVCITCATQVVAGDLEGDPYPCPTVRRLASIYADHPDYRSEWKP